MVWMRFALLVLTLAVLLLVFRSRTTGKHTWRTGYWTGKAEVHNSLRKMLSSHADALEADPSQLANYLREWLEAEHASDRALAHVQEETDG